ncbi:thiamine pyrophosphate-dependent dehydrogenase E1 component subunit alpha [Pelobacter propionicus]|uniref:Pyruvate dehydrogenase (Acetyl-transferring) n=1 Tax=Pelobacter propionicus (strain DSM 2379 / NBRC 103807 / OttBd1) TaxID=338966 RepID=A1AMT0_PELPD|nr:thiamine pyrophosphate-dependent dehydrogenase E1 component subunit alpha [Pelobacter propionicus]ABK98650.1 Pyruvate dehydrogenase (acetyl-transferring) [Pelobacter propionicus DSM 2379]ABK98653.1 Pyruvate dehydrogenase (acetyl-transferring) [Pelobacter propionicus DSM 2379]
MTSQLKKEDLLRAYRTMREIREFEDRLHIEFATGKIPGFVHLYSGEEAVATGVCMHLTDEDRISSTHRGHGHCIAKGVDIHGMMAEIYGKKTGTCGGKGGSMHIADLEKGMMGANGIVGAGPPLICGAALAAKFKGNGGVGVAFFGDGASNQGTILESMNLASVWKLPVIFLNENNGYAESTGVSYNVPTPNIADRAAGFGMPGVTVDGNDFFAVYEAAGEAIRRARAGEGPTLLECKTQRYFGHFEGDAMTYRPNGESQNLRKTKDCLKIFAEKAIAAGLVTAAELEAIDKEVLALIEDSVVKALAAPKPTAADLLTGVYVSY